MKEAMENVVKLDIPLDVDLNRREKAGMMLNNI